MADTQLTLQTLPHEILREILKTHFSEATVAIRVQKFLTGSSVSSRGRTLTLPDGHRSPMSFNILLSCRALHHIGTQAMFRFTQIKLGGFAELLIEELPPFVPFRNFRCISIPLLESYHLKKWPWENLRETEVADIVLVDFEDHEDDEDGAEVTQQCHKLWKVLGLCKDHDVEITADITFDVTDFDIDKISSADPHQIRFVIDKTYSLSLISMTNLSGKYYDRLQSELEHFFVFHYPKPEWPEDEFTKEFTLRFRRAYEKEDCHPWKYHDFVNT